MELSTLLALGAVAIPTVLALAALAAPRRAPLRWASRAAQGALVLAAMTAALWALAVPTGGPSSAVRVDRVTVAMLLLVTTIGAVVARYSESQLARDARARRYARWLLATLASVTALVASESLVSLAAAWTATSLCLHQLLLHFEEREAAVIAAHKKFLVSRLADVFLWTGIALVQVSVGETSLSALERHVALHPALPAPLALAAASFAAAACLKSAQLPFHGWLTQVMEAPTPVSALLHAGVVNLGGFLLIRLAPLFAHAPAAQLGLVAVGMTTATVSALVMTTRVSIKVALAWSTCAQMGLMVAECGLGAWHVALLHLLAHSVYKALAFLSAGGTVAVFHERALAAREPKGSARRALAGASLTICAAGGAALASIGQGSSGATVAERFALALLSALAVSPALTGASARGRGALSAEVLRAVGLVALFFGAHAMAHRFLPPPADGSALPWLVFAIAIATLYAVETALTLAPRGPLARALHPWLFAGLYLDEAFTRATFRVWPPRRAPAPQADAVPRSEPRGALA